MKWSATRHLSQRALAAASVAAIVTALGASHARAQTAPTSPEVAASAEADARAAQAAAARVANPFAEHFPNVVVRTHEGRNVRFYDDLLKDKIVLINFMYATCTER